MKRDVKKLEKIWEKGRKKLEINRVEEGMTLLLRL